MTPRELEDVARNTRPASGGRSVAPFFDGPLPRPTTSVEAAKADLQRAGYAIVLDVMSAEETAAVRSALAAEIAKEEAADSRSVHRDELKGLDPDDTNRRLRRLPDRHPHFCAVLEHPVVLELTRHILGPTLFNESYLVHSQDANVTRPGGAAQGLHRDRTVGLSSQDDNALQSRFIFCLDQFDEENGATRVVPGSHLWGDLDPTATLADHETVPAEAPAGSLIVYTDLLVHGTGANSSTDRERASINFGFCPPWCRPTVNYPLVLDPTVMADTSVTLRQLLGYSSTMVGLDEPWESASDELRALCVSPTMEW